MTAKAKFLFNEDFAAGESPTITIVEHERRRADAESQAYRKGFAAGQEQARGEASERIASALAVIAASFDRLERALGAIEARLESEAVEVAVAVASKLASALVAREPLAELAALASESFRHLISTPQVTIWVGADIYDAAKQKLEDIAQTCGFEGRLTIQAEAGMAPGDCRIEWNDGGVIRDPAATRATIDELVARYLAARATPADGG
ncbi:MAG: flagellar assembly protein FliH [Pseudolabrys sp.]|nr:flagellar assembly protein FliH [Pseudolabrys sp.]